jgi:hypothetical protein
LRGPAVRGEHSATGRNQSVLQPLRSRMWTLVLLWDFSNQCPHLLSQLRHAKAPWLHGRYAASTLLRTSPTPPPPARALWISTHALLAWRETGGRGLSSSWWFLLRALSPLTPESPTGASGRSLRIDAGFTSSGRLGHPQLRLTRPNRVRASLRLAHLPPPAPIGRACSRPSRVRLRGSRPFTMTNTFSSLEPSTLLGAPEGNERNKGCN